MTKKILKILEKAWITAALLAIGVAVFNFFREGEFNYKIYFPLFVAVFCFIVYLTKKKHRKFLERFSDQDKNPER